VHYSDATAALIRFAETFGIPVAETQAGKGALPSDHSMALGATGVTGTAAAIDLTRDADLVISIGCRLSDFTTASKSAFQHPAVTFIGINVVEMDAFKHAAIPVIADARAALDELQGLLAGFGTAAPYRARIERVRREWDVEVDRLTGSSPGPVMAQAEVIGIVNRASGPRDVVVCAAGSLPGELHKLWRTRDPKGYHLEYGYSCMGYEIAGGLGVKMADPAREVYVMVGDGSYLMMAQEIVTSVQEGYKLVIVLVDSGGFASIGALSRSVGSRGFGTHYRYRDPASGALSGGLLPVDLAANAESLGAVVFRASDRASLERALDQARASSQTAVVYVPVDPLARVPGHGCWWDVPVAEVSEQPEVEKARAEYEQSRRAQRWFL
jgi:3D-(3,5/4)-trihydroxycyclohexane-1,2-dione acylhydrolase (decyclizing)